MNKVKLTFHLVAQILAQGAVVALVPAKFNPLFAAIVAIIGVVVAFLDNPFTPSTPNTPTV